MTTKSKNVTVNMSPVRVPSDDCDVFTGVQLPRGTDAISYAAGFFDAAYRDIFYSQNVKVDEEIARLMMALFKYRAIGRSLNAQSSGCSTTDVLSKDVMLTTPEMHLIMKYLQTYPHFREILKQSNVDSVALADHLSDHFDNPQDLKAAMAGVRRGGR